MEGKKENHPYYWGDTPEEEFYEQQGIKSTKGHFTSPTTGLSLYIRSWLPATTSPSHGMIFMIHGYGNDTGWTFQATPIYLAQHGFACYALDLPGHGRSEGLKAFVPSIDDVVTDCTAYFDSVRKEVSKEDQRRRRRPCFLYGESMGGAICLLIHLKRKKELENEGFDGAVLISPMCKISEKVKPPWPIPQVLTFVGRFLPTLPIVPTADLLEKSVKVPQKKTIAMMNPMRYHGKPRLGTVIELLRVTDHLGENLTEVSLPFVVMHGSDDVVTDPAVSKALYEDAKSKDKTLKIYDGMMHSLVFGEPDENVEIVRKDIVNWLIDRCFREMM